MLNRGSKRDFRKRVCTPGAGLEKINIWKRKGVSALHEGALREDYDGEQRHSMGHCRNIQLLG